MFLNVSSVFSLSEVAHTIRCQNGAVLVMGTSKGIAQTKEYLPNMKFNTVKYIAENLREKNIEGISKIEEYYEEDLVRFPIKKFHTLTVKDAVGQGLIPNILDMIFFDAALFLEIPGYKVIYQGKTIGRTLIYPPVNIIAKSAGNEVGNFAHIYVDNIDYSKNQRGYNIVVVNQYTGEVEQSESFDTRAEPGGAENSQKMKKFLENVPEGKIVVGAVRDEASKYLTYPAFLQLKSIGGKTQLKRRTHKRFSHALIGIKGIKSGEAEEGFGFREIELFALKDIKIEKEELIRQKIKFISLPIKITPDSLIEIFQ